MPYIFRNEQAWRDPHRCPLSGGDNLTLPWEKGYLTWSYCLHKKETETFWLPFIMSSMWPPLLHTRGGSASGLTITFETIVSFLAQLIVKHESIRTQLLFILLSLRPWTRHLPIYARSYTVFWSVLYCCFWVLVFTMVTIFNTETLRMIWCAFVKTRDKNSIWWRGMLDKCVVPATTVSTIIHISSISCVPGVMVPWCCQLKTR